MRDGLAKLICTQTSAASVAKGHATRRGFATSDGVGDDATLVVLVFYGALAQLGERLLCKHQVIGSIPIGSTILLLLRSRSDGSCIERRHSKYPEVKTSISALGASWRVVTRHWAANL